MGGAGQGAGVTKKPERERERERYIITNTNPSRSVLVSCWSPAARQRPERTQTEMFGSHTRFPPGQGASGEAWEDILLENLEK